MSKYKGEVKARIVDLRFASSGKIVSVGKHTGEAIKKGNLVASLDRKILQAQLDKQQADYDKVRADFDAFAGIYATPASASVKLIDEDSYFFEFEIGQKEARDFTGSKKVKLKIEGMEKGMEGETLPVFSDEKKFLVMVPNAKTEGLLLGMAGTASF